MCGFISCDVGIHVCVEKIIQDMKVTHYGRRFICDFKQGFVRRLCSMSFGNIDNILDGAHLVVYTRYIVHTYRTCLAFFDEGRFGFPAFSLAVCQVGLCVYGPRKLHTQGTILN